MNDPVPRIIDVNLNRAGEALRTIEEYARFALESPPLSRRLKELRHDLAAVARDWSAAMPAEDRPLAHRDIVGDVGTDLKTTAETNRPDIQAVAAAAFRRGEESLRVLSEYGKIANPAVAAAFESLRYRLYALEPLVLAAADRRRRLAAARLYVLITGSLCSTEPLTAAREAVAGGADIIQMREKELEDGEFHRLAADMAAVCREGGALFIVNDRPHIAALVGADGIHGGQGDLPVHLTRRILGPDRIIGRSTSAPSLAEAALADGADYIGVGPVYATNTKQHRSAMGLEYVTWAAAWDGLPFFAIGSVNRDTIAGVLEAGARSVAICTAITMAPDIAAATAWFKQRLEPETV
ncbi:MAG: thiamine phosphate synthase [Planctomycetes bacterium]|nr:thiamine phosphate synthase [Planctomycetota bacterium]